MRIDKARLFNFSCLRKNLIGERGIYRIDKMLNRSKRGISVLCLMEVTLHFEEGVEKTDM